MGAQSAVNIHNPILFLAVIKPSPINFFFVSFFKIKNLELCIWFKKTKFFFLILIFLETILRFFKIFSLLLFKPNPKFKVI